MAITINGTGTVTGVSVGGLPDGIVDTDMLAAGAVTAAKRGAGAILQVVQTVKTDSFSTNTGASYVDITGMSITITPSSSSNKILIIPSLNFIGAQSHRHGFRIRRNSTSITADTPLRNMGQNTIFPVPARSALCNFFLAASF